MQDDSLPEPPKLLRLLKSSIGELLDHAEYKNKTKKWNHFSQVDALGSFDFFTSIISLDALVTDDLLKSKEVFLGADRKLILSPGHLTTDQYHRLSKVLPLAIHEYTHFVDTTSTLWGLRHLHLMNEAYSSQVELGGDEQNFFKAKQFYEHVRGIRLPNYYTVVNDKYQNKRPWRSAITLGKVFSGDGKISNRSILFSRFSNADGDLIVRSPISIVSLLEASAMAQEVHLHTTLISGTERHFRLTELRLYSERIADYLYDHKITEYSVCVHVVANKLGCSDIQTAFRVCGAVTRIVLNFPKAAFQRIAEDCPISRIVDAPDEHEFVKAIVDGVKSEDRGVLYYLLVMALPKGCDENPDAIEKGIHTALVALGTDYETLKREAVAEAKEISEAAIASQIGSLSALTKAGFENFQRIEQHQQVLPFRELNLPPVLLGDSSQINLFATPKNTLSKFDLDVCLKELFEGQLWVERFSEACL